MSRTNLSGSRRQSASLFFGVMLALCVFPHTNGQRGWLSPAKAQSPSAPIWCRGLNHPDQGTCGPEHAGAQSTAPSLGPDALWAIVHGFCVPNQQQHGNPAPCAAVDLTQGVEHGYAVIKDPFEPTRYLLVPTKRITGIEDAAVLAPDAVNYFDAAWNARSFVNKAAGRKLPDDAISLAINSPLARSQNQLHIHIDCIRADVRRSLARDRAKISERWSLLTTPPLGGRRFEAIRVMGTTLAGHDPFKLLADGVPGARTDMKRRTLAVTGMNFGGKTGFVVLAGRVDAKGGVSGGSRLQDHSCALAR